MPARPAPVRTADWLAGRVHDADGPVRVERVVETQGAVVFLGAERAWKQRKAVDRGVVDHRRRRARWDAARVERALGARIAPHVYEGVLALPDADPPRLVAGAAAGEPVLVMRRLPDEACLARRFAAADTPPETLAPVVRGLAAFHAAAPRDPRPDGHGDLARLTRAWTLNFDLLPPDAPDAPLTAAERARLRADTDAWLRSARDVLEERVRGGRVRDGHGDLRLEHVFLTTPWAAIDPLEVEWLRFADVALDVAFPAMELDALARPDAARFLAEGYAEATEDRTLLRVLPFFQRHLALVRARVEWARAQQLAAAGAPHLALARRLTALALAYELR